MRQSLRNDLLIRALLRQPVDYTPIWLMRQAGRYLPEYCKVRSQVGGFMQLCQTPELACEVTLQPVTRFNLDAAILFSDILTIPHAMGIGLEFLENEGPVITQPVRDKAAVLQLPQPDPETELRYVMDAVRYIKQSLDGRIPLIGFAGSPWTLAAYMVEGRGNRDFWHLRKMLYQDPHLLHQLLEKLTQSVSVYLNAQIAAGVDVVMVFDTWGGLLTSHAYQEFSLKYMKKIQTALTRQHEGTVIPQILFSKGGGNWLEAMANSGYDAIGVDWTVNLGDARTQVGNQVALQGNLDPAALMGTPQRLIEEAKTLLASYGHGNGHIFNLGHGIDKLTNPEQVALLVKTVQDLSRIYH